MRYIDISLYTIFFLLSYEFSISERRALTMSPEKSQYIWRNTISHIEVEMGSGVFPVLQWCPPGMKSYIFVPALLALVDSERTMLLLYM